MNKILIRAAEIIEEDAHALKESHTTSDGKWDTSDPLDKYVEQGYNERISIATKLRLMGAQ